jgi:hypothetical protein
MEEGTAAEKGPYTGSISQKGRCPAPAITGLDLVKNVFQIHAEDVADKNTDSKRVMRRDLFTL